MFDVVIKGGLVIDGTGSAARTADVGIRQGRIAAIGTIDDASNDTIDAGGKIVCPGFVDIHTHYDAQAFWDGSLSPSPFHGVTTVVGGNCGFSIAPLSADAGDYLMRMLARVEGMPLESLLAGVPWNWTSFGEYLERLEGRLAVNAGFMVGHSAIRRVVMGERAVGQQASEEEIARMVALLRASIAQGGMGFSSTASPTHNDGDGNPVPSRHAERDEMVSLTRAIRDLPGTALEFLPGTGEFTSEQKRLMTDMSLGANRPLNWNVLIVTSLGAEMNRKQLAATDEARARGAEVVALTVPQPMTVRINLHAGFVFDALHGWADFFKLPMRARMEKLRDPDYRRSLDENGKSEKSGMLRALAFWEIMSIDQTVSPENERYRGRNIGEIAKELGKTPFDTMIDIAMADDLKTSFMPPSFGDDEESWRLRGEIWKDDRTVIGASDAGAHLDMIDTFAFSTQVLGNGVRKRSLLSWEEAIRQLTDVPARLYGLRERGRLAEGWHADVVVFDPETVGTGPTHARFDLPAGGARLYADADGIDHVFVNGAEIVSKGVLTDRRPGSVLHSGRDTETVEVPGGRDA
jgi:N-acyl-D-aspartate/D-glutamate deacylase